MDGAFHIARTDVRGEKDSHGGGDAGGEKDSATLGAPGVVLPESVVVKEESV